MSPLRDRVRTFVPIAVLTAALALASAPDAHAECLPGQARPSDVLLGVAFIATVAEATETSPDTWHVQLDMSKVYRGDVPPTLVLKIGNAACTFFEPSAVAKGDRLFFAIDKLTVLPAGFNESLSGPLAIWRQSDGGWTFAADVVWDRLGTYGPSYWSAGIRRADSVADILAATSGLPDTAAESPPGDRDGNAGHTWILVLMAGFAAFILACRCLGHRVTFTDAH
jgi:hypothetical protein